MKLLQVLAKMYVVGLEDHCRREWQRSLFDLWKCGEKKSWDSPFSMFVSLNICRLFAIGCLKERVSNIILEDQGVRAELWCFI